MGGVWGEKGGIGCLLPRGIHLAPGFASCEAKKPLIATEPKSEATSPAGFLSSLGFREMLPDPFLPFFFFFFKKVQYLIFRCFWFLEKKGGGKKKNCHTR